MNLDDILKDGPIILKTAQDVEEVIKITEDGNRYLAGYIDDIDNPVYKLPTLMWIINSTVRHQSNKNGEWSDYANKLTRARVWGNVREQYLEKQSCCYCRTEVGKETYKSKYSTGTFCSEKCADKADMVVLALEVKKEKNNIFQ
jgi:hypothetical protein